MSTFQHDGVSLAYDESGATGHVSVVLLHGLSSARSTWRPLVPELTARHRVFTLDHRGHGESSHAPDTYVMDHYGRDAVAFCEDVVREPAVLVGHSLGGVVAFYVAQQRPDLVRGVLLEDPPLYLGDADEPSGVAAFFPAVRQMLRTMREQKAPITEYLRTLEAAPALSGAGSMADALGREGAMAFAEAWSRLDPEVFTPAIDGGALSGVDPSKPLECPAVVLRADPARGAAFTEHDEERFLAANTHASVVLAEGASHAIHDEQPDLVRRELTRFLDTIA